MQATIASHGCIADLVAMLTVHESPSAQEAAAEAILQLATHDANRWQVAHNAGLPALVGLLEVDQAATPAVLALAQMAENKTYHEAIVDVRPQLICQHQHCSVYDIGSS